MSTLNVVFGIIFLVLAIALLIPGVMAATGRLPGNKTIGLQMQEVREHEITWVKAHKVVGPFWILGAIALFFSAAFSFIAAGWVWIMPVIGLIFAVVAISLGGNYGARTAILVDKAVKNEEQQPTAPAPKLDIDALRRAAGKADGES